MLVWSNKWPFILARGTEPEYEHFWRLLSRDKSCFQVATFQMKLCFTRPQIRFFFHLWLRSIDWEHWWHKRARSQKPSAISKSRPFGGWVLWVLIFQGFVPPATLWTSAARQQLSVFLGKAQRGKQKAIYPLGKQKPSICYCLLKDERKHSYWAVDEQLQLHGSFEAQCWHCN